MTMCAHGMFACVCKSRREESTPNPTGKPLIAGRRRVCDYRDTTQNIIPRTNHAHTTTTLGTHYTHNNTMCVQSVGTISGGSHA